MVDVLALVTEAFGGRGGIARYNRDFLSALAGTGAVDRITVLPRLAPDGLGSLPGKVEQRAAIFNPGRYSFEALRTYAALPRGTLIFCGHLSMSPLAASLAPIAGSPLWLQVHGIDAWAPPWWSVRWGAEQATLITSVSRYTKSRMAGWWNGNPSLIRVLPNTVETQFSPGPKPLSLVSRYQLAGKKVILTVSRLSSSERYKGHEKVIAALPEISAKLPDVAYLIVGDGDDVGRLRSFTAERGVSDRVVFAGHVPESELPDHFRLADVYAMPSSREGFGIVFLEAALTGLPVIGGNCDGSVDALADGQIGRLVNPECPEQIVNALIDALEGRHVGNAAAVQRFAFENYAKHIDDLVRSLVH